MSAPVLGAQLYTVREFCKTIEGVAETAEKIRKIGYTAVQISGFGKDLDPREIGRIMKDNGLTVAGTHMGWDRFTGELDAVIEEHKLWDCHHPAIGSLDRKFVTAEGVAEFRAELVPVAEKLAQHGMTFSYHNHNHEFVRFGDKPWLELLYEGIEAKYLKAEIDTYWVTAGGGDPAAWIRKYPGRQPLVHFKDMAIFGVKEREQRFAPIGEGNLNWPEIIKAVREVDAEFVLVEQDNCYGMDQFEALAISYRNLKALGLE
jgi:sugar phosphate isomerase/epimerase